MRSFMFQTSFTNLCFVMPSPLKDGESMIYGWRESGRERKRAGGLFPADENLTSPDFRGMRQNTSEASGTADNGRIHRDRLLRSVLPKRDRRRVSDRSLCPHTAAYEKSGHCRIADTGEERTDRGDESEEDTENTKRKRRWTGHNERLMTPFSRMDTLLLYRRFIGCLSI